MSGAAFSVKVWGARGSLPVSGEAFRHFGGNTTSIVMTCGGRHILFDAGSGIMPAGKYLRGQGVTEYDLFLTHCHYDHMIGLPYLSPMFDGAARLRIWSGHLSGVMSTRQLVEDFMRAPWFPISPSVCAATLSYRDFSPGHVLSPAEGVVIRTGRLNHPGGAVGYRVEYEGRSVAIITDTEHQDGVLDPEILELIRDVDLFFYDASYTEAEMETKRGFGHSTWQQGVRLAQAAGAARVGFLHHAPWRSDAELFAMEEAAQAVFPGSFCVYDGQDITL